MMNTLINKITKINQQILSQAKEADWNSLAKNASTRHQMLEDFFENNVDNTINLDNLNLIKEEINLTDRQVLNEIKKHKNDSIHSGLNLKKIQTALNEYQSARSHISTS